MSNTPPPPPPHNRELERKPWVKPVVTRMHEVTSTRSGAKQPGAEFYEGGPTGGPGEYAPPTPYSTYGPFQNI